MKRLMAGTLASVLLYAPAYAERAPVEEVLVIAEQEQRTIELTDTVGLTADTATLLKRAAGADVVSNGPITGMAQIRGMSRFRVASTVDGAMISPGGPNWMDTPLSYAPAATLERLLVHRGVAPVSAAAESIGGVVSAESWRGTFAETSAQKVTISGVARTGVQSANNGRLGAAAVALSNRSHKLRLGGSTERAHDLAFAAGDVVPTAYRRERYDLGYAFRAGAHEIALDFARLETGDSGTPALPMDIQHIDSDLFWARYTYAPDGSARVRLLVYGSDIEHGMSNYHLRQAPASGAAWRRNLATGDNLGLRLTFNLDRWQLGLDAHRERHTSDISNPNSPMFFVDNFNDAQRRLIGAYVERTWHFANGASIETGLRLNRVTSDAGTVNATPAVMGMPPALALRNAFNAADRSRRDTLVDTAARFRWPLSNDMGIYVGAARKSRAPAYQERYLWLPLQATAGLADGRVYTGQVDLDPEVAHDVELGFDWQTDRFSVSPRVYHRRIDGYITAVPSTNTAALMFTSMMGTQPALMFDNVDATFSGFDVDWRVRLSERLSVHGLLDILRAERRDGGDDLYRMPPANGLIGMAYVLGHWTLNAEVQAYRAQRRVSNVNGELATPGYAIANIAAVWQATRQLRVNVGVENVADKNYRDHLAGVNRAAGNADIARGERLPGAGRNAYLRIDVRW